MFRIIEKSRLDINKKLEFYFVTHSDIICNNFIYDLVVYSSGLETGNGKYVSNIVNLEYSLIILIQLIYIIRNQKLTIFLLLLFQYYVCML